MSDKIQMSSKEPGVCVETGHGRSSDPSPRPPQKQYSNGSNVRKQQNRTKGNYGNSRDKRPQRYPRSGPGGQPQPYAEVGHCSSGRMGQRHSGSDPRNREREGGQEKWHRGRDRLKETDNVHLSSYLPGVSGSLTSRPGSGNVGRRKATPVSLNHLLNFTVAPTERRNSGSLGSAPLLRRRRSRQGHSYNKEQFLQANCQFVVSSTGDYTIHSGDPDRLVDWDCIEQVRLLCHQIPSCPICLYPPTAAKITRCGHVYCWSCVLHYLALGERKWRKCPICYESIDKKDLKSVIALSNPQFKVGDTITMKLMMKEKGTTLVCPKSEWTDQKSCPYPLKDDSSMQHFVKLLSATPTETLELITNAERDELERQLSSLGKDDDSERCFVEAALEQLKVRELALKQAEAIDKEVNSVTQAIQQASEVTKGTVPTNNVNPPPKGSSGPVWTAFADNYFEGDFAAPFSDLEEEEGEGEGGSTSTESSDGVSLEDNPAVCVDPPLPTDRVRSEETSDGNSRVTVEGDGRNALLESQQLSLSKSIDYESPLSISPGDSPEDPSSTAGSQPDSSEGSPRKDCLLAPPNGDSPRLQNSGDIVYFYQAADGQHLYIHPINAKCLAKEYGGLENAPEEIKATIVEMEQLTMSEDVRGRYRYLSHLPLTCEFVLCELELRPPILSQDTLKVFSEELQKRKQKRIKKKREERRRERKREPNSEPTFHVPTEANEMTPERFHDFLSLASSPPLRSSMPPHPPATPPESRPSQQKEGDGREGVRDGGATSRECGDESNDVSSAPSFAQALRGKPTPVWPIRPSKPPASPRGVSELDQRSRRAGDEGDDQEDEESHVIPSFQNAFNKALLSASVSVIAAQSASGGKPGSKTAKKGRKKLVLFSTGGMRGVH